MSLMYLTRSEFVRFGSPTRRELRRVHYYVDILWKVWNLFMFYEKKESAHCEPKGDFPLFQRALSFGYMYFLTLKETVGKYSLQI